MTLPPLEPRSSTLDTLDAAGSPWTESWRADPIARAVADRHYNRQKIGAAQFVPPGRCLVLRARRALWITSWPFGEYVKHRWPGAWVCSAFRREVRRGPQASTMIRAAVAATRAKFGDPPELGMITFVNAAKVKAKATPGYCFLMAGFLPDGESKGGLLAFRLSPDAMPLPRAALPRAPELCFPDTIPIEVSDDDAP